MKIMAVYLGNGSQITEEQGVKSIKRRVGGGRRHDLLQTHA